MESLQKYVIDHHQKTIAECSNERIVHCLAKLHEASKRSKEIKYW